MSDKKNRFAFICEYCGTNYAGSQKQCKKKETDEEQTEHVDSLKTIQGEVEKALSTLIKTNIKTFFSGRTDAGVHSKGQVVHFDTDLEFDCSKFVNSMCALLPNDISVKDLRKVESDFHSQKSAVLRWYRYLITNRKVRSSWDGHSLLVREELDVERMNKALSYLRGEHDFTSFKSAQTENPARICNVEYTNCFRQGDKVIIDIAANRFLYNMVRTIVGTLLLIERKSLAPESLKSILDSKDRAKAGTTISPDGLYLMKVSYDKENNMEAIINENLFS